MTTKSPIEGTDLRKNQGPLGHRVGTPDNDPNLPFVCEILEYDGEPVDTEVFEKYGPDGVFALHWGDWGSVERIFEVFASAYVGRLATDSPPKPIVFRIMHKIDGEVVHVVRVDADPPPPPPTEERLLLAVKRLLHYSWKDISFGYDGLTDTERSLVSPEDFAILADWAKDE